jgi:hypothetical protein
MSTTITQSLPVMLAGNQTREITIGGAIVFPGRFGGISLSTQSAPGSGDVTLVSTSVWDGGGNATRRYVVKNNRPTPSEFIRTMIEIDQA